VIALPATVAALRGWLRAGAAVLAGVALTLAQPPLSLWPMLFVGWPALLWLIDGAATPRAAALIGWLAGAGFFLTGLYWIGAAFLVEASKVWWYGPVMPLAVFALAAVLAAFWAGAFWAARRFWPQGWRRAVVLALAMTVAEVARGSALTGFPWAAQAHAWVATPVMQLAALTGAHALSGLTVLAAALVGVGAVRAALPAALAVALGWGWGAARLASAPLDADGPVIRLVQPNVGQRDKWAAENARPIFEGLLALSAAPAVTPAAAPAATPVDKPPALVVWPEVAVTFLFDESAQAQAMAAAALPPGASLAVGAVRAAGEGRLHNSLLFYGPDAALLAVYDKRHLAPFGEYVPYVWLLGALGIGTLGDGLSGFAPGETAGPFALPGLPPVAPLICYEIVFPGEVASAARGADWMLQVTNDAWFGDSGGPRQHLAQARVRAIEQGLPVARAANTGVSAMIDPYGRIRASLPLGVRGALDSPLPARAPRTVFARIGDAGALALLASAAALVLLLGGARRR